MGKATNDMKNRMKVLALANKAKRCSNEVLTPSEEISECKAHIRQCERDMETIGRSSLIEDKIKIYKEKIKKNERLLQ